MGKFIDVKVIGSFLVGMLVWGFVGPKVTGMLSGLGGGGAA